MAETVGEKRKPGRPRKNPVEVVDSAVATEDMEDEEEIESPDPIKDVVSAETVRALAAKIEEQERQINEMRVRQNAASIQTISVRESKPDIPRAVVEAFFVARHPKTLFFHVGRNSDDPNNPGGKPDFKMTPFGEGYKQDDFNPTGRQRQEPVLIEARMWTGPGSDIPVPLESRMRQDLKWRRYGYFDLHLNRMFGITEKDIEMYELPAGTKPRSGVYDLEAAVNYIRSCSDFVRGRIVDAPTFISMIRPEYESLWFKEEQEAKRREVFAKLRPGAEKLGIAM